MTRDDRSPEREGQAPQVFISYSHDDVEFVRELADRIGSMGYRVWLDERSIQIGDQWDRRIDEGLRSSDVVVGVLTRASLDSDNVQNEWVFAQQLGIPLKLLRLDPLTSSEMTHTAVRISYIDFAVTDRDAAFSRLADDLASSLGRSQEAQPQPGPSPEDTLVSVQQFHLSQAPHWMSFLQDGERFWVSDGEQIEAFSKGSAYPASKRLLPNIRWKHVMTRLWRDRMVCSDWDGSLYAFGVGSDSPGEVLYQARYDDLPSHCLEVSPSGELLAATWDGEVMGWAADGTMVVMPGTMAVQHLPRHILSGGEGHVAVADQGRFLSLFSFDGGLVWRWQADGDIESVWACHPSRISDDDGPAFILLLDDQRLVLVEAGHEGAQTIRLPAGVSALAHLESKGGQRWTALALDDRSLRWLSWRPFRLLSSPRVALGFELRQLIALHDPQRPGVLLALGLSNDGQLLEISDADRRSFSTPSIRALQVDPSGRFLFMMLADGLHMVRNPAVSVQACEVTIGRVEGALVVGEYRRLEIELVNSGSVPIGRVSATLRGLDRILPSPKSEQEGRFMPGDHIRLGLSVRAIAAGLLPLDLNLDLEDEAGPPETQLRLDVNVHSTGS